MKDYSERLFKKHELSVEIEVFFFVCVYSKNYLLTLLCRFNKNLTVLKSSQ